MKSYGGVAKWVVVLGMWSGACAAVEPPSCPRGIRIVVPYQPGGGTDVLARHVARALNEDLRITAIVDNQPGAASVRGTQLVGRADPDGCTLGMVDTAFTINAGLLADLPYDTTKDFMPVSLVGSSPIVLTVPAKSEARQLKDLIDEAKRRPGSIAFGSAGVGTSGHLAVEDFSRMAGIKLIHVAYKGAGPAVTDLIGGHVALAMIAPAGVIEHIRAGTLRPLAVTSARRIPSLPDTPTFAELGYPTMGALSIWGLIAPAGTPRALVERYQKIVATHSRDKEWVTLAEKLGMSLDVTTPAEFASFIAKDIGKWAAIVKTAGVKPE